jgi:hypothetical protein
MINKLFTFLGVGLAVRCCTVQKIHLWTEAQQAALPKLVVEVVPLSGQIASV